MTLDRMTTSAEIAASVLGGRTCFSTEAQMAETGTLPAIPVAENRPQDKISTSACIEASASSCGQRRKPSPAGLAPVSRGNATQRLEPGLPQGSGSCRVKPDRLPFPHPDIPGAMLVRLTGGHFAVIDTADADAVSRHTWCAAKATLSDTLYYAVAKIGGKVTKLHRFLWLKWGLAPSRFLDHEDGDPLNCRRTNIRQCTQSQNLGNAKLPCTNTSGFKGVTRIGGGRWRAAIKVNGAAKHLGIFGTAQDAGAAYLAAAQSIHGEFARAS